MKSWDPPDNWHKISTIDAHTGGEPLRVIIDGFPEIPGSTMLKKRRYLRDNFDHLRTTLMLEPRGHSDMYGCILTPAITQGADFGILFMHNEGFSTMCGHGIIGIATVAIETGIIPVVSPETTLNIDTPAGRVSAHARIEKNRVKSVYFRNVPSFVLAMDETAVVTGVGEIRYDIAFGGAFYAYVKAESAGLTCYPGDFRRLIETGMAIKHEVMGKHTIVHPFEEDLGFLYGIIFTGPPLEEGSHSRNVCVFADGEIDRSPTGTGVSGRLALHHARKEIAAGQTIIIESIIGSKFSGKVAEETLLGSYDAIIPEIEGSAFITGRHEFLIDPADPLKNGFILR